MIGFEKNPKVKLSFGDYIEIGKIRTVSYSFLQSENNIGYLSYISRETEQKLVDLVNSSNEQNKMVKMNLTNLSINTSIIKKRVKWTVEKLYGRKSGAVKFISSVANMKFEGHLMYVSYCINRYIWFVLLTEDSQFEMLQEANKNYLELKASGKSSAKPSSLYGTSYVYVFGDGQGSSSITPVPEIFKSYSEKIKFDLNLNLDFKNKT